MSIISCAVVSPVRSEKKALSNNDVYMFVYLSVVIDTISSLFHCTRHMQPINYLIMYEETPTIPYIISSPVIASLTEL